MEASLLSALFAVAAAVANAAGTVLQRVAARTVPTKDAFSPRLVRRLVRDRAWLAGIGVIVAAAVFQALALAWGAMSLVQPILVLELPLALVIARVFAGTPMPAGGWTAALLTGVGLALALSAAAPVEGGRGVSGAVWTVALLAVGAGVGGCTALALRRPRGKARAALFGSASALCYGLTAALMNAAIAALADAGVRGLATTWQTYACAAAGGCALFLLANAMESGPLFVSQPALTLGEAAASLALGAVLYGDSLRTGWWIAPQAAGAALTAWGVVLLAGLPAATTPSGETDTDTDAERVP
ncbi:DMT family transporter [Streptomyces longispororuber]|uniref:DMT family transporter n=1 Tax=Streptomyces longispororuber TaxID=68230 RepID=UPI0033C09984